jgi:predicted nucleic acid-binding protein
LSTVFVDTSGVYALLVASDAFHGRARAAFEALRKEDARLVTTSYVLVESYALLGRRIGVDAVRRFRVDVAPLMEVIWVDRALHEDALDSLIARGATDVSLVDAVSFAAMRAGSVDRALTFDAHFADEGFETLG